MNGALESNHEYLWSFFRNLFCLFIYCSVAKHFKHFQCINFDQHFSYLNYAQKCNKQKQNFDIHYSETERKVFKETWRVLSQQLNNSKAHKRLNLLPRTAYFQ